jgi:glycosidase
MQSSLFIPAPFLAASNIYEVNIRQYTAEGTFNAFAKHIPRLKEMGVQILWLMPIFPIGKKNRKGTLGSYYSIADFKNVNTEFGTKKDFENLIAIADENGMKVILDWVANHTAWDNDWTVTNPEFYVKNELGNFVPPYDWDDVIQLDHTNEDQQTAMIEAMQYWITTFNIDGFRADMAHLIPLPFWKKARMQLSPLKKDLIWLAETEDAPYAEAFDITYTWEWMHTSEAMCKQQISLKDAVQVLEKYKSNFPTNHYRLFYTSNHDENSWTATEYEKYGAFAKTMAVFSCMYNSIPLIYSGQELPNYKRLQFFDKDVIEWESAPALQDFYTALYDARKRNEGVFANTEIIFKEDALLQNILCYSLQYENAEIIVCLNFRGEHTNYTIKNIAGTYQNIFTKEKHTLESEFIFTAETGGYLVLEKLGQ